VLDKSTLPKITNNTPDLSVAENIPMVCHYDANTVITKDGELVQTIEITGDVAELSSYKTVLKDEISKAISESVTDFKVAVYIHTVRSRKNMMPKAQFKQEFAQKLNDAWCKKNNFDKQLVNTVYITLVYQGLHHKITDLGNIIKSLFFPLIRKEQFSYLESSHKKLTETTDKIVNILHPQGARKLGIIESENNMISEQMVFFHHLIHLEQRRIDLTPHDMSLVLSKQTMSYNFNSIEINNYENKQYAAVFSIKDHYDLPQKSLDQLLQLGFQYVLCQVLLLENEKAAKAEFSQLADIEYLSKNQHINEISGLKQFLEADSSRGNGYCKHQTTITVFSDDPKFFEDRLKQITKAFSNLGISCIREDFNMAAMFWAQIPGNMRFLKNARFSHLDIKNIGSYCTIFGSGSGAHQGSKWGAPISLVRSELGTPFYFNFHNKQGVGNTLLLGPSKVGKSVISKFLITQALKNEPRIIYIDLEGSGEKFITALNGTYLHDAEIRKRFKINPFDLNSFKNNTNQFKDWLIDTIFPRAAEFENYNEVFAAVAEKIYSSKGLAKKVDAILDLLTNLNDTSLNQSAQDFFTNKFPDYFSEKKHQFDLFVGDEKIIGLNMAEMLSKPTVFRAYIGSFLESLLNHLDGTPTIIYINNLEKILAIPHVKQVFGEWLRVVDSKNAIMLGNCSHQDSFEKDQDYKSIISMLGTIIFLSDKDADKYFRRCYGLSDNDLHKIKIYRASRRIFLCKQDNESSLLSINLDSVPEILETLA
jgi:type IV secretion system protein VirB4